jgi:tight adherence protein B
MAKAIVIAFILTFAVATGVVLFAFRFIEEQKKKKVTQMLQTAADGQTKVDTKILIETVKGSEALAKFMNRFNIGKRMEQVIIQAGMTISLNSLLILMLVMMAAGAFIGGRFNPLVERSLSALACGLLCGFLPYMYVKRTRTKRMNAFEEQLPEALEFISRAMRAGHAFGMTLEMLAEESPVPLSQEFRKVYNEHNLGLPIETALQNLAQRVPLLDVSFFVSAVLLQRETGGNLSEILLNLSQVIRERFKLKGAVKAASAHGRITGSILTLMPVALVGGLMFVSPGYLTGMANDPDGKWIIVTSMVFLLLGHFFIRKIVKIKV